MLEVVEFKSNPKFDFKSKLKDKKFSIQFLPESLKKESLYKKIEYKQHNLKVSYLVDIAHNLLLKYYFKKDNIFNLSSVVLKEKYGYIYNYYIDYLVESKILILVKKHQKGKNARIYKLSESVINGKITRYKNDDKVLLKKYKNAVSLIEREEIKSSKIKQEIKQKLVDDLFHVDIDFSKAIFFLESTVQDTDIYNRNKYSVECINDKHIFYHFDHYGRMHTNFTILKSFIRKNCLMIDGDEVCEFDIKNSQPLFLSKIIQEYGNDTVDHNEFELFKFLTINGKFYQYMIDNSSIKDKKLMKESVYKVFFGKNYKNKKDMIFKNLFPTIYEFIKIYKKSKGDYKVLAHELQNLESELIFNKIVKEILDIDPNIHIITIHDSIVCSTRYREIVGNIFNKNLRLEFLDEIKNPEENNIYSYV
jgi:hypothetical protein